MQEGRVENIELQMKDNTVLRGWFVKNSNSKKSNLLIYFGANHNSIDDGEEYIKKIRAFLSEHESL